MGELASVKIHPPWILPVLYQIIMALRNIDSEGTRDVQCFDIGDLHEINTRDGIAT
jgi:hypothetical protein